MRTGKVLCIVEVFWLQRPDWLRSSG